MSNSVYLLETAFYAMSVFYFKKDLLCEIPISRHADHSAEESTDTTSVALSGFGAITMIPFSYPSLSNRQRGAGTVLP